jgi:Holliday junction DNA helicase RuvA
VPGIGKRTAERIIVELREKVGAADADEPSITISRTDDPRGVAREGLLGLGYNPVEVESLLAAADGDTAEELIASALRGSRR